MEDGQFVIYVICKKAIYGTMNSALLAYKKLVKLFQSWGLVMNPYDPCCWNKWELKKQLTILLHIDDLFLTCALSIIITKYIIKLLNKAYGSKDPLTMTWGKVHEYLGMTVDFTQAPEVKFSQYDFVKKLWLGLPESLKGGYKDTPAPANLFKLDADSKELDNKRKVIYHNVTAKCLWMGQRLRPDIQLTVGFHCTRVKAPTELDSEKLKHLL